MSRAFMIKQAPFKPTDIGGCQLWLDGADPAGNGIAPVNGSSISTWVDKSTGGYNMIQGTGSLQPIYNIYSSYPGLYFNGTQYLSNASLIQSGTGGRTTFFVFKDVNTNSTGAYDAGLLVMNLTSYGAGQGWSVSLNGSSNILGIDTYSSAYISYSNSTPVTNMRNSLTIGMVQVQSSGTVGNIVSYGNGTLFDTIVSSGLTSSAVNTAGVNTAIGALPGFWYTNAYIYEILHYNVSISSPQRQKIEAYLAQKWGLRQQLPQGHPGTTAIIYPIQRLPNASALPYPYTITPLQIQPGSCKLWLDGADPAGTGTPPSNGATVSTWVDKSTTKNAAATGSPTYVSGGGINFNGSSYFVNQTFSQNLSQRSIFIIMQETTHSNYFGVFPIIPSPYNASGGDGGEVTGLSIETTNGLTFYGNNGGYNSFIGNSTLLTKSIYNDNMNGSTGSGYFNGSNSANVNAFYTAGTCSGYGIGARWLSGAMNTSWCLNGIIYEIIFYNTPLATPQRQQVEGYLAWKWGLQANLPPTHPYKNSSPNTTNPLGISRPANVLPIPSIVCSASVRLNYIGFTITGSTAAAATNYQIPVTVYRSAGTNTGSSVYLGTAIYSDYSNLLFRASDQVTALPFYIESGTQTTSSATIWVSVPSIPASPSTTKVYIYWYPSGTYTSPSSGTSTFPSLFDDFNGTSGSAPNASIWSVQLKGTSTSSSVQLNGSGQVILTPTDDSISSASLLSVNTIPANGFSIYIRRKYTTGVYPDTSFAITNTLVDGNDTLTTSWWHTTLGGGYQLWYQNTSYVNVARRPIYTGSIQPGTDIIVTTISASINTYEIVEIQYSTAGVINILWNGVNKGTATDTTFLSGGKYLLISQGNYTGRFNNVETVDYVFVRSYLNPEPAVSAWGSINTP